VFIKYPAPAAPDTGESPVTFTAAQDVPPASNSSQVKTPPVVDFKT